MQITLKTRGMDALSAALSDRLEAARLRAAQQIADQARKNAPVATGELRDSIHVDDDGNVKASAPHSIYVEMGTSHRAATPFLAPAAVATMPDFEQAIKKAVDEVANGF